MIAAPGAALAASAEERFTRALDDAWRASAARDGASELALCCGDVAVAVRIADRRLAELIGRACGHLTGPPATPAVTLSFFAGGAAPPPPWPLVPPRPKGEIGDARPEAALRGCLQLDLPALHVYDRAARRGWAWYADPAALPSWEHPHLPLRLLHFALADRGWSAAHGAVVARDGVGFLLPGRSGTGKTTTALAAVAGGWEFLGDDHVLVRPGPPAEAASLFATTRLTPRSVELLAAIGLAGPVAAPATPPSDKSLHYVSELTRARVARRCRLAAVVVPRQEGVGGPARRLSPARALQALAPSTVLFLPHAEATGTFARLARLVRGLPSFELPVGPDLGAVAPALDALLARLVDGGPG